VVQFIFRVYDVINGNYLSRELFARISRQLNGSSSADFKMLDFTFQYAHIDTHPGEIDYLAAFSTGGYVLPGLNI